MGDIFCLIIIGGAKIKSIIIYATRYGSAEKSAKVLRSMLQGEVQLVNIMRENAPPLDEFDNVIIGGSIYIGKLHKELSNYIKENIQALMKKKVGLFICAGSPDLAARAKELESVFPQELYNHAVSKELFGYELIFEKMGFFDKVVTKSMKGDTTNVHALEEENIKRLADKVSQN